ncbi:MAG TPA: ATP-binding protein [Thermodesulfobacteriota bacterium]|nr:hypothetical protein [Deltaproteobacteria bacterium]HNR13799.1 ATP-binding protein [Thermodesulfobacteriota bacterium]HNU71952.1 ATP-binding protein [Thermodesulfobacteriota bacterium]HQO77234.1 ATP-binding protein [Thermodesulfobacteriota bacterium]
MEETMSPGLKRNHYFRREDFVSHSSFIQLNDDTQDQKLWSLLNQRLAALGQVASGIAHEISNPLATIKACAEGLIKRIDRSTFDPVLFRNYLEIIQEEIVRCTRITSSILSFVQDAETEKQNVDIHTMLDRIVEMMCFQGRLANVKIEKKYQQDLARISTKERSLQQVFLAITVNGLEAMRERGTLTYETGMRGAMVYVKISNSGPAIPPHHLVKIFDPFFTTKTKTGGTGLGLYIANNIIRDCNGEITVSSEEDKGTTFTIMLPL